MARARKGQRADVQVVRGAAASRGALQDQEEEEPNGFWRECCKCYQAKTGTGAKNTAKNTTKNTAENTAKNAAKNVTKSASTEASKRIKNFDSRCSRFWNYPTNPL